MSSQPRIEIKGQSPFKQSGVYEAQISLIDVKPSDDEIHSKTFSPLWKGNFHLRVKDGVFSEVIGDSKNPLPKSINDIDVVWVVVNDLFSSLYSVFDVKLRKSSEQSTKPSIQKEKNETSNNNVKSKSTSKTTSNFNSKGTTGASGERGASGDKGTAGTFGANGAAVCATQVTCGNTLATTAVCAVARAATNGDSLTLKTTCANCVASYDASDGNAGDCMAYLASNAACGVAVTGTPGTLRALTAGSATVNKACAACAGTTFAATGDLECKAQTVIGTCKASRFVASNNIIDSSCTPCGAGQFGVDDAATCAANTACGNTLVATGACAVPRLSDASRTVAGTCTACAAGSYRIGVAPNAGDCLAHTTCGKQANGDTRLTGTSAVLAGTCAACTAGTYASGDTVDCVAQITCGNDASGTLRVTTGGDSVTAVATCAACAAGSWAALGTDNCVACTAIANAGTGATYSCSSSTTTRFATGGCTALTHYKVAGTNADSCAAVTACSSNQLTGACFPRVEVDAPTATADRTCTPCAAGSYAAANGDCLAHTTCGDQVDAPTVSPAAGSRLVGASGILAGTCAACTTGTWGVAAGTTAGDCATQTVCANQLAIGSCAAVARVATNGASVTVSMADDNKGMPISIERVRRVFVFVWVGRTSDAAGTKRTSSKVRASIISIMPTSVKWVKLTPYHTHGFALAK